MNINDPKLASLRQSVKAAREEFDLAIAFHETWKPTAYDEGLHQRMGTSYATNAFNVVRTALRREMVLALMRLWDKRSDTVRLERIAKTLDDDDIVDALAADRATQIGFPEMRDEMKQDMRQRVDKVITLINKYCRDGSDYSVRDSLQRTRHERLAHRNTKIASTTGATTTDEEIEYFYCDVSEIVRLLLSVVEGHAYDPVETGGVFRQYAGTFGPV